MKIDDMTPTQSQFLKKEDVGEAGVNLTIKGFEQTMVGQGDDAETKWVIVWTNPDYKPMVLNKENGSRLKMVCKSDDTDQMIGRTVNAYNDPYVAFGGKVVGGIRLRAPQGPAQPANPPQDMGQPTPPIDAYGDDDVPY